jgi:4-amino-4-deoxy-L-arabinose transferase-like glycosyltransferase
MISYNITRLDRTLEQRPWLAPLVIFLGALALRSAVALHLPAGIMWSDGARYMRVADNLLQHGTFGGLRDNQYSFPTQVLLLAGVRWIFGTNFTVLRLFFALLGAASCVVGYYLAQRLFGRLTALVAGIGLTAYPAHVYLAALFEYPQTFFILTMAGCFLALFAYNSSGRLLPAAVCGLCLGLAILTVPTVQLFAPLLLVAMIVSRRSLPVIAMLVLVVAACVPVGAWATRNYLAYGDIILVNRGGGFAFWSGNNQTYYQYGKAGVTPLCGKENEAYDFCREFMEMRATLRRTNDDLPEEQRVAREERAEWDNGKRWVSEAPGRFVELTARKAVELWTPLPDAVTNRQSASSRAVIWVSILSYLPVLLLGAAGVFLSRDRWRALLPVYGYFIVLTGVYAVFLPTTRYRLPLDFFLIIFTAHALTRLLPGWSALERERASG